MKYAGVIGCNQGHSDFLIKVHDFPDLLSWSFPDGVSGLRLVNNYRVKSLPLPLPLENTLVLAMITTKRPLTKVI